MKIETILEKINDSYHKAMADQSGLSNDYFYDEVIDYWEDVIAYIRKLEDINKEIVKDIEKCQSILNGSDK